MDEMLCVDRCWDMDELINFLSPIQVIVQMPEPDRFLRYYTSAAMQNFMLGKSDIYVLAAAARRGLKWFIIEPVSRRNTFVNRVPF